MSDPTYPLTWPEALKAVKQGALIECSCISQPLGYRIMAVFDPVRGVLVDHIWQDWTIDIGSAEARSGWRIVSQDSREGMP